MDEALSNSDIKKFFNGKVNILTYDLLEDYDTIEQVMGKYGRAIILYFWQDEPKVGHWVTVFKTPRDTIEFFNSFGSVPDKTLDDIPVSFKATHGESFKRLTEMLLETPLQIEYNDKCLQQDDSSVCGYYCIVRLCCKDIPIERFQQLFTKNKRKNDELVLKLVI